MASQDSSADNIQTETKIQLYGNIGYGGATKDFSESCPDLTKYLSNGASSIIVPEDSETWHVFTDVQFNGESAHLYPGDYNDLNKMKLKRAVKSFRKSPNQIILKLFERQVFGGKKKAFSKSCDDLTIHFQEGASSIMVNEHATTPWQVFTEPGFKGASARLEAGKSYESLEEMELQDPVKSFRKFPRHNLFRCVAE